MSRLGERSIDPSLIVTCLLDVMDAPLITKG
jgi:hypothetical protein